MAHPITLKSPFIPSLNIEGLTSSSGFVSKIHEGYAQFIQTNGEALAQTLGFYAGKLTRSILLPLSICQLGKHVQNKIADGSYYIVQSTTQLFVRSLIDIHWIALISGLSTAFVSAFLGMEILPIALLTTSIYFSSLAYKQFSSSISSSIEKNDEKRTGATRGTFLKEKEIVPLSSFDTFPLTCAIIAIVLRATSTSPDLASFFHLYAIFALPSAVITNPPYWFRLMCYSGIIFRFAAVDLTFTSKLVGGMIACETVSMLAKKGISKFHSSPQYHHLKNAIETKFNSIQKIFTKSKIN